jgi:hypothetical protein
LSNFFENNTWHDWFPIRPDTGLAKRGTPQKITAVWGDPNNPQHLNLFMTDQNGTVKSIFCTLQPGHSCWTSQPGDPAWFSVGEQQSGVSISGQSMLTPGQRITAIWRRDDNATPFSHLDLFAAGTQETGLYREKGTNKIKQIPGQDIVKRPGTVLSNFWERDWGTWFPVPLRAEALPGMDDGPTPCGQTHGLVGIVSTPVIEPATNTMFVVYRTGLPLDLEALHHSAPPGQQQYRADARHWLAAIDIGTGRLKRPPVQISAPNFSPSMQLNRSALLLDAGTVYVAFAAAVCDFGGNPYAPGDSQAHGWVFAYDARSLAQKGVFTTANAISTKDNHRIISGIWQSGNGLASDSQGNVYAFTGNNNEPCGGATQPTCPPIDYSESIVRLKLPSEFETPKTIRIPEANDLDKNGNDGDLSAGGPVLPFDNLLIGGGKQGVLYSIHDPSGTWPPTVDRFQAFYNTHTSQPSPPSTCDPQHTPPISQYAQQSIGPNIHGSPVVFKPAGQDYAFIYAMPEKDYLRAFKVMPSGTVEHCPTITTKPPGADGDLRSPLGMPGGFLSISANNDHDGIVWVSVSCFKNNAGELCPDASTTDGTKLGRLMAFDALNLKKKLWEDPDDNGPSAVPFAKFVPPTVAGGHVFRAAYKDKIYVYGLRSSN